MNSHLAGILEPSTPKHQAPERSWGRTGARSAVPASSRPLAMAPSLTALALVLALAGCSQTPDWDEAVEWVNPVSWFDSSDDGQATTRATANATATSSDKPFPKLGEAPAPQTTSTAADHEKIASSLVADRDNARYTDQNLRAGNHRMAAAPPPPPAAPTRTVRDGDASTLTQVPSIVQRRGSLPPPPAPITEVSRTSIPQVVQKPGGSMTNSQMADNKLPGAGLPKPPTALPVAAPTALALRPAIGSEQIKLIPPPTQLATAPASASVQVNLPLAPGQTILEQTYAASLAAQGSPVVRRPGNVFNAPNAAPISGQWPTNVPGVVQQAFNASLSGTDQKVQDTAPRMPFAQAATMPLVIASPQMSNNTMRRLPGAPMLIRFRHGSTQLTSSERKLLGQVASQAKGQGKTIYVVGHASQRTGDMDYAKHKLVNFGVSLDRANRVAGELRRQGVAAGQIVVQAKGDSEPLYFEFMPDGEAKNRRVEVFIR